MGFLKRNFIRLRQNTPQLVGVKRRSRLSKMPLAVRGCGELHCNKFGSTVIKTGNATRMISLPISAKKKGNIPLNIVPRGRSGATPWRTNTFKPMGGVIMPISITTTLIIPHHMGL